MVRYAEFRGKLLQRGAFGAVPDQNKIYVQVPFSDNGKGFDQKIKTLPLDKPAGRGDIKRFAPERKLLAVRRRNICF